MQWTGQHDPPRATKEAAVQTPVQPAPRRDAACAVASPAAEVTAASAPAPLFPPRDADAETRRRWLATSPWPEVVFAAAV